MRVVFDVDGTLIDEDDEPRQDVIDLMRDHYSNGDEIYVWSGGGVEYARAWVSRLGLTGLVERVIPKQRLRPLPDLTYDDQIVTLGVENVCVGSGDHEERW